MYELQTKNCFKLAVVSHARISSPSKSSQSPCETPYQRGTLVAAHQSSTSPSSTSPSSTFAKLHFAKFHTSPSSTSPSSKTSSNRKPRSFTEVYPKRAWFWLECIDPIIIIFANATVPTCARICYATLVNLEYFCFMYLNTVLSKELHFSCRWRSCSREWMPQAKLFLHKVGIASYRINSDT